MNYSVNYPLLCSQLQALIRNVPYETANFANAAALLWQTLPDINWAGFYLRHDAVLALGPFQGKPACTIIPMGKGVCGAAAVQDAIQVVADVHQFPGHIACDSASASEIVVPIHKNGAVYGVLDIDSPLLDRFSPADRAGLEAFVEILEDFLENGPHNSITY